MFKKTSDALTMLLALFIFGGITFALIMGYIEDYNLSHAEKAEIIIGEKIAKKSLFLPPSNFVIAETDRNISYNDKELKRISSTQMKKLEPGDSLSGFKTADEYFSTVRDFLFDSMFFVGGIVLFGFLSLTILIAFLAEFKWIDRLINKTFLGRPSNGRFGKALLILVISIFFYFASLFLFNLFHKTVPLFQTETEAVIADTFSEHSFRKYEDPIYEFTLKYKDTTGGNYTVKKEVTRYTYEQYYRGDSIAISYQKQNPYNIFIKNTSLTDIFHSLIYLELLVYISFIAILIFLGYVYWDRRRKQKE